MTPSEALVDIAATVPVAALFLVVARGLVLARREARALLVVDRAPLDAPLTVVVPARNEGARVGATLDALLADESAHLRVLVADDGSTDDTRDVVRAAMARDARLSLTVLHDDGTTGFGKPLALARATKAIDGAATEILFLDADVTLTKGALGGLVRARRAAGAAALSGNPRLVCASAVEEALVPAFVALVAALYRPSRVMDARDARAFLNGQCILIARAALDDVGGFDAVKDTVLEDVALARLLKARGHRLALADLRPHAATRMYTSWSEIRSGFGKNAVALFEGPLRTFALGALALALGAAPLVSLAAAIAVWRANADARALIVVDALGVTTIIGQSLLRRAMGQRLWPALVVPLTQACVAFVLVEASVRAWRGGPITWRGRTYPSSTASTRDGRDTVGAG